MMIPDQDPDVVVCVRTLGKLCDELGPESVDEFIDMFTSLWPSRMARLRDALASGDMDAGEDAALSLKSAATMAGAYKLAGLATKLQQAFRDTGSADRGPLICRIERAGTLLLTVLHKPDFTAEALHAYRG